MALQGFRDPMQAAHWLRQRVTGTLHSDSRQLAAGDGFLAWPGASHDGRTKVAAALARGVAAALVEATDLESFDFEDDRIAGYAQLKAHAGPIASAYFGHPSRRLEVLAVTGTNGKTSTAWWLAQALSDPALSRRGPCAVVGTLGLGRPPTLAPSGRTSPDPVLLQRSLHDFVLQGCSACAIEATSIGLIERRLDGLQVHTAILTNFTQDHLDYHGSMAAYWEAKAALFRWPGLRAVVLNLDDAKGELLAGELRDCGMDLWTYSCAAPARLRALEVSHAESGLRLLLQEAGEQHELQTQLGGAFNASNLLAVLAGMRSLGVPLDQALLTCRSLQPVPGRMEMLREPGQSLVAVDYAHTPDALEKVLEGLRPLARQRGGRLWCLFGCGGNRDASKRAQMAAIAGAGADRVLVTSDNPRREPALAIIEQILAGFSGEQMSRVLIEADRGRAIALALRQAQPEDVILIAGKGHEEYQEVMGVMHPFSDRAVASSLLRHRDQSEGVAA